MATNKPNIDWDWVEEKAAARADLTPEEFQKLIDLKAEQKKRDSINSYLEERRSAAEKIAPGVTKWTLGYSEMLNSLEEFNTLNENSGNYPPHDILVMHEYFDDAPGKTTYQIVMALAGFEADDIQVWLGENTLNVDGSARNPEAWKAVLEDNQVKKLYTHAGIAKRDFSRKFLITDNMKLVSAVLSGGMLTITLDYVLAHKEFEEFKVVNGDAK